MRTTARFRLHFLWMILALLFVSGVASAADTKTGEQIFRELCAGCHGKQGEGVATEYANPLIGDRSIGELARLIDETMPAGEPEKCSPAEAKLVAEYIYNAFYSPTAQARNRPPRIELARLTVRQYRQSVSDLITSFRWTRQLPKERGLKAEYFKGRNSRKEDRVIERVDPVVSFDYGEGSPDKEKIEPKEYFTRWNGAVIAPETGDYEFTIKSENAVRLWINDNKTPLIDAWVQSGSDREFKGTIFLLAGQVYQLRMEHLKSREKTGSIALWWQRPHQLAELLPERFLVPEFYPELYVVSTKFPPDDRSMGYERGTAISKAWDEATTDAAFRTADYVLENLDSLAGTKRDAGDRNEKIKEFCRKFAERAFRRPLSDEQKTFFVEQQLADAKTLELGVKRSILLVLKSPRFLFPESSGESDGYAVASRLALDLWDSLPDRELLDNASRNQLKTPDQVRQQAFRMVRDPRATAKFREFLTLWLKLDRIHELSKDPELFPGFDPALVADLRTSLELFLDQIVESPECDYRQLLLAEKIPFNGHLAKFYGVDLPEDAAFQPVALDPGQRSGVLTHPFLLAGFAYHSTSSPIHRGVFISRSVLGRTLRNPPEAVAPLAPDLHPNLTTRERTILQTSPQMCQGCHAMINPLGFTMEHFDAVGRYRKAEQGKDIDAAGFYITRDDRNVPFRGARELAEFLVASDEAQTAFVEQLFHFMVKQPIRAHGEGISAELVKRFRDKQFNMRDLQAEIAAAAALVTSSSPPDPAAKPTEPTR